MVHIVQQNFSKVKHVIWYSPILMTRHNDQKSGQPILTLYTSSEKVIERITTFMVNLGDQLTIRGSTVSKKTTLDRGYTDAASLRRLYNHCRLAAVVIMII